MRDVAKAERHISDEMHAREHIELHARVKAARYFASAAESSLTLLRIMSM